MAIDYEINNDYQQIKIAIIIAIILGLVTSFFFLVVQKESYSAIYLVPNSIIHNPADNTVIYSYGVTLSDSQKIVNYTLDTYIDDELIKTRQFSLNNGETLEERVKTVLSADSNYPKKITLTLNADSKSESVHFWITNTTL
jgi:hypothetical protein